MIPIQLTLTPDQYRQLVADLADQLAPRLAPAQAGQHWPERLRPYQAAQYLGISKSTLRSRVKAGIYRRYFREGEGAYFLKSELDKIVK